MTREICIPVKCSTLKWINFACVNISLREIPVIIYAMWAWMITGFKFITSYDQQFNAVTNMVFITLVWSFAVFMSLIVDNECVYTGLTFPLKDIYNMTMRIWDHLPVLTCIKDDEPKQEQ